MTVTLAVRVIDSAGNETVVNHPFETGGGGETILTGDIDTVVLAGTTARLRGACRLINNLHVRGVLKADPDAVLDGQGLWDIHTHDGGVLELQGTEKTAWLWWGDTPTGWQVGDRLAVAPTIPVTTPLTTPMTTSTIITWQGSWSVTTRPSNSPNYTDPFGQVHKPEVANLSQTLILKNLTRIMLHESTVPNVHVLKWLNVKNSGKTNELAFYPIHFHQLGETARGSLLEEVVVEGGKNHAFVPHGSHGIDFIGCAAVNTVDDVYWWDPPPTDDADSTLNSTHDTNWERCLALGAVSGSPTTAPTLTGFNLDGGDRNKCNNCVAAGIGGSGDSSGFKWPERGGGVWEFRNGLAHNNKQNGIFTWQNSGFLNHLIDGFTAYRCGKAGIEHGAYVNYYKYRNIKAVGNFLWAVKNHALTLERGPGVPQPSERLTFEDVVSDGRLEVSPHRVSSPLPTVYRRCQFTGVTYRETGDQFSFNLFEDCGLTPADFLLTVVHSASIIEIREAGVLTHRWAAGAWS